MNRLVVDLDCNSLENALAGVREGIVIMVMPDIVIASHKMLPGVRTGLPIIHHVPRSVVD